MPNPCIVLVSRADGSAIELKAGRDGRSATSRNYKTRNRNSVGAGGSKSVCIFLLGGGLSAEHDDS
eukprot:1224628-Amorphochlora_amoeboformis.AAC.1